MKNILNRLLHPVILWGLLLIYMAMALWIMPKAASKIEPYSNGLKLLDLELSYTLHQVQLLFETLGEEGRTIYRVIEYTEDFFYPLSYGLLLSLGIVYFFKKSFPKITQMALLGIFPLVAMMFDYAENFLIIQMLSAYPQISETKVILASSATTLKWGFVIVSLLLIFSALIVHLFKRYVLRKI
ncbi:MAG: hypothetical protein N2167_07445 [Flavobacteriales bacterium]|nr:hypothetical protein [Flavobacteriales bacterium]